MDTFGILCITLLLIAYPASAEVSLKFLKTTNDPLPKNNVEEDSTVRFKCQYDSGSGIRSVDILSHESASNSSESVIQHSCTLDNNGGSSIAQVTNPTIDQSLISSPLCDSRSFSIDVKIVKGLPKYYSCEFSQLSPRQSQSSTIHPLRSHTVPDVLSNTRNGTNITKEGESVTYICQASARPPPNLRFLMGNEVQNTGVTQTPLPSDITEDTDTGTTTLQWSTTATKSMNGKVLRCEVDNHISGRSASRDLELAVYYGPDPKPDERIPWNLGELDELSLNCDMESNPDSVIEWYNSTVSNENKISGSGKTYTLNKSLYSHITESSPEEVIAYYCKATNPKNNNKNATKKFIVTVFNADVTTTTTMETTTATESTTASKPDKGGVSSARTLSDWTWEWALIAIAIIIVIAVVLVAVVCLVKRHKSSPAQKKKAAAKGSPDNANSFQRSNRGQPDIITNNQVAYTAQPNADYRHSKANVEDYADAFDDKPRSRRPVALDDLNTFDNYTPTDNGPPGYQENNMYNNSNYMSSPQGSYSMGYGAPC